MKNICICGGGSLGHVISGFISSQTKYKVSILTRHPERWNYNLDIDDLNLRHYKGKLSQVTDDASLVVPNADIILLCLPGYGIKSTLNKILPYVSSQSFVGSVVSSTGFFFMAIDILPSNIPIFGFQRVPFIARVKEYGKSASILGYKTLLNIAVENALEFDKLNFINEIEGIFKTPVHLLSSHYEASLTNSNPLLHTSRLYTLFKDWTPGIKYNKIPKFYADWTCEASHYYIKMDDEFQTMLTHLPVTKGAIPSVLEYYESSDEESLRNKLSSIPAFASIDSPMIGNDVDGYEPDFKSRYFTEDFPYGLNYIVRVARQYKIKTPYIDMVYKWGNMIIKKYSMGTIQNH